MVPILVLLIDKVFLQTDWEESSSTHYVATGMEPRFEPRGAKAWTKKNFMWHGLSKKKIMVDKKLHFIIYIFKSRRIQYEPKKLKVTIWYFNIFRRRRKKEEEDFRSPDFGLLELICWFYHVDQLTNMIISYFWMQLKITLMKFFKTLFEDFKKLGFQY